jgi:hypothetical protein
MWDRTDITDESIFMEIEDDVFSLKYIKECIVKREGHIMILNKYMG